MESVTCCMLMLFVSARLRHISLPGIEVTVSLPRVCGQCAGEEVGFDVYFVAFLEIPEVGVCERVRNQGHRNRPALLVRNGETDAINGNRPSRGHIRFYFLGQF